jgi:hypothetical protein
MRSAIVATSSAAIAAGPARRGTAPPSPVVDPVVAALRREHHRAEQLERRRVLQRAAEVAVQREKRVVKPFTGPSPSWPDFSGETQENGQHPQPRALAFLGVNCAAKQRPLPRQAENGTMYSQAAAVYSMLSGT